MVDLPTATEPATPITNGVRWVCLAQERGGGRVELVGGLDVEVQQPGQRQVDLADLLHVQGVAQAAEAEHVLFVEGLLHLGSEPGPGLPVQLNERGDALAVRFVALQSHLRDSALDRPRAKWTAPPAAAAGPDRLMPTSDDRETQLGLGPCVESWDM